MVRPIYTTPTASPEGFGTSPFECFALKGGGKREGGAASPLRTVISEILSLRRIRAAPPIIANEARNPSLSCHFERSEKSPGANAF